MVVSEFGGLWAGDITRVFFIFYIYLERVAFIIICNLKLFENI